ncbi:MAG: hypothetical protein CMC35_02985 [Flavobacteriaceae bacterium]|nr:hypothetical protein [Flavobacteriaceae bacterium]|tara:strand:+ start:872 stop:1456 length:585 start_codon:yes stop_codon:yes gene_type:complete
MSQENNSQENVRDQGIAVFRAVLSNKSGVTAKQIIKELKEGNANPAYVGTILKKFAKIQETVFKDDDVKDLMVAEVSKYFEKNKKTAELYGAKITVAGGTYMDYSEVDDPYLKGLEAIEAEVKELISARKDELKAKFKTWQALNKDPRHVMEHGLSAFEVTYERLPRLEWDEGIEVIYTNPPVERGKETLRFTV